ncbi:hypothetical protein BGZ88_008865 [Linnemannia elongata]|nr:hypothetical protein BGZ88_008865 [Linnemannia elongata]
MPGTRNRRKGPAATITETAGTVSSTHTLRSTRFTAATATADAGDNKVDTDKDNDLPTPLTTNITTEDITNTSNLASSSSHPQLSSSPSKAPAGSSAATRRRGARSGIKNNRSGRLDKDGGAAGGAGSDSDAEVEMPRRETFGTNKSDNFVNQSRFTASLVKDVEGAMDVLDLQDPLNSSSPQKATSVTTGNAELQALQDYFGETSPLPVRVIRDASAQDKEKAQQKRQDDVGEMISRLSLSPPPPPDMFELLDYDEDYIEGGSSSGTGFAPWLMHFDSEETAPAPRLRTVLDLRVSDLETSHHQSSVGATSPAKDFGGQDMEVEEDKEGDDPFGFFKVERKLSRRWSSRPSHRLSAINERVYRPDAVMNNRRPLRSPLHNLRADINDDATASGEKESLEKVIMERVATRRRGGAGQSSSDKGKTAMRSLGLVAEPTAAEAAEAADIEKAVRLSLNDLAGFEKTGESSSSASASVTARPEPADVTVAAGGSLYSVEDVASPMDKEVVRSNRRISRMYGRSQPVAQPVAEEIPSATTETTAATTIGARNDTLELDDLFSSPPSTPPRKPAANRSLSDNFRNSIDSDDFSPIVLEATPTKKPEAGMPSTFDFAGAGQRTRNKPKKFMASEQLAAMLPRPRKLLVRTAATSRSSRRSKGGDNVFEVESDVSADESGLDEVVEEEEEEEEEVLVRRRPTRSTVASANTASAAKSATTTTATATVTGKKAAHTPTKTPKVGPSNATKATANTSSQKRHAPASTITAAPASKRPRPQKSVPAASTAASSGSKSRKAVVEKKGEEDRSQWTEEQRAALEERIRYFSQIDDFELEVESC